MVAGDCWRLFVPLAVVLSAPSRAPCSARMQRLHPLSPELVTTSHRSPTVQSGCTRREVARCRPPTAGRVALHSPTPARTWLTDKSGDPAVKADICHLSHHAEVPEIPGRIFAWMFPFRLTVSAAQVSLWLTPERFVGGGTWVASET